MRRNILKEYATVLDVCSRFFDPTIVLLTTYGLYKIGFLPSEMVRVLATYNVVLVFLIFPIFKIYKSWRFSSLISEAGTIILAWLTVIITFNFFMINLISPEQNNISMQNYLLSDYQFQIWGLTVCFNIVLLRLILRLNLRLLRSKGYNIRTALMVGSKQESNIRLVNFFNRHSWMGIQAKGFLDDNIEPGTIIEKIPVLGRIVEIKKHLKNVDVVYIALPMHDSDKIQFILTELADSTTAVYLLPDIFTFDLVFNAFFSDIGGVPAVALRTSPYRGVNGLVKRAEDLILGSLMLILFAPAMLIIALGVKLSSPGPVLFRQKRCGLNGQEIMVNKFRTMMVCEDGDEVEQATKNDPRVTRFGAFLRKTSLDELPQIFNVLGGSMSLVGPRPHALSHNDKFRGLVPGYMLRHQIRPGITGLAQVNGWRGETDTLEKIEKRIEYDLKYLNSWSIWMDLKIILLTALNFFRQPTAY